MYPTVYPLLVPGLFPPQQEEEQMIHGPGLYAVCALPSMQPFPGYSSNTLIPFTYNIPTEPSALETTAVGGERGQAAEQQQQAGPQIQDVVRRFQIAVQLDLMLMLKLAVVIYLFNKDGSRKRLALHILLASLIYLYQTGSLAPLIRLLTQGMQRAAAPQQFRPPFRAEDVHAAVRLENENAAAEDGQPGVENENHQVNNGDRPVGNEHVVEPGGEADNLWFRIVKEIQIFFFGFIASLVPGFHNID
ncbi:uncharacterized protein LOC111366309 [Olea europaea subsp. europaea]|nr:uncharacterized protein LOC111366309 [Olea europaea subsp. europaea]